jgi:ribosomal protein S12 methylthiotransferase accessory factor
MTTSELAFPGALAGIHGTGIHGTGLLATAVAGALAAHPETAGTVLLSVSDGWDTSGVTRIRGRELVALPVWTELDHVVIGPAEIPGEPGCLDCYTLRHRRASTTAVEDGALRRVHGDRLAERAAPLLGTLAADTVAALVAEEVQALAAEPVRARTRRAVLHLRLADLTVTRHRLLPDPLCPTCGHLPDDGAERATIELRPQRKLAPDVHRVCRVVDDLDDLLDTYVDSETGLIRSMHRDTMGGLVIAGAMMPIRSHDGATEPGVGRTRSYRTSQMIAILEALERYGGVGPGGRRTVVTGSFAELAPDAIDPTTLGVHPPESYAAADFYYRPFTPEERTRWVWGWSFLREAPLLVPETVAYYHVHEPSGPQRPFLYEISNGCALGSTIEEAILHGILETAERDAFLMTWYARLPVPELDLTRAADRTIGPQAAAITAETGYRVHAFDITMEQGIPSVWVMAVRPDGMSPDLPRTVCAAGSSLVAERAVLNALSELGPILVDLIRRYPQDAADAHRMAADPTLVTTMPDHSTLYGADETFERFGFLFGGGPVATVDDMPTGEFRSADLSEDLRQVIDRYLGSGLDVIVVDQTTPEHEAGGLRCVKVLIPGTVPMTFGHRNRRIHGLPRLLQVPYRLGHRSAPLTRDELNPDPHPFP